MSTGREDRHGRFQPNTGIPRLSDGRTVFPAEREPGADGYAPDATASVRLVKALLKP